MSVCLLSVSGSEHVVQCILLVCVRMKSGLSNSHWVGGLSRCSSVC